MGSPLRASKLQSANQEKNGREGGRGGKDEGREVEGGMEGGPSLLDSISYSYYPYDNKIPTLLEIAYI